MNTSNKVMVVGLAMMILAQDGYAARSTTVKRSRDTVAPVITALSLPSTANTMRVSGISISASDDKGVTGYHLRENSVAPALSSSWLAAPPTSFTFSSAGAKTLFAWVRDAAGNISAVRSANITIVVATPTPTSTPSPSPSPTATPTPTPTPTLTSGSWQQNLDNAFDIVETFDELQPWRGRCGSDFFGKASTPKKLDGSDSMWTYYSCWGSTSSVGQPWIDDFGLGNRISGKSLVIDMGRSLKGPSRLGVYFGKGTPDSGYDDIYIFYRVRFPANEWPTRIDSVTKVGEYYPNEPFVYYYSWKFGTLNMGCTGMYANNDCDGASPYSDMHLVPHIKRYGYGAMAGKLAIVQEPTGLTPYWALGKEIEREKWLGVEFHYKLTMQGTERAVIMETWIYDENGTAYLAQAPVTHPYTQGAPGQKFNFYFLGGNNSGSYSWGPTMESGYHVDDFIINGSRIGPTYFQMAGQQLPH